jgi:isopentenyl-diphosphate delta-isomerase
MTDIARRKLDHIALALSGDVAHRTPTGFDRYYFLHEALPELAPEDVDLSTTFLGKRLAAPFLVASMTGGPERGADINRHLAEGAQATGVAMGVGSQRIVFERPETLRSFQVAREAAPDVLLVGNIGAVQLNYGFDAAKCAEAVRLIGADALYLHLNALQEIVQPEGDTNFRGLIDRIAEVVAGVDFPVLIKEVGSGIAPATARALAKAGVAAIDLAGVGGTSWAKIEGHRADDPGQRTLGDVFGEWGIPTETSLRLCREALPTMPLIASGGIRTGLDAAKAIALGADLVSFAKPLLAPATRSGAEVELAIRQLMAELRTAMFLLGIKDIPSLKASRHLLREVGS